MKTNYLILLILISANLFAQYNDTIYIDPTAQTNGSGQSPSDPLDGWFRLTVQNNPSNITNNTCYLSKRGTIDTIPANVRIRPADKTNIKFGAYGNGEKPIIHTMTRNKNLFDISKCDSVIFENLILEGDTIDYHAYSSGTGGGIPIVADSMGYGKCRTLVYFAGGNYLHFDSCIFRYGGISGITFQRVFGSNPGTKYVFTRNVKVIRCEFYNLGNDGIFYKGAKNVEISYCSIYNTNMQYRFNHSQEFANGTCIAMYSDSLENWWVHHNYLDHSTTGNKETFTMGRDGGSSDVDRSGIFEYNTVISPMRTDEGGSGARFAAGFADTVRFNFITGEQTGMEAPVRYLTSYGNIFYNFRKDKYALHSGNSHPQTHYNNIFYNCKLCVSVANASIKNTIFLNVGDNPIRGNNVTSDYNCYYGVNPENEEHFITDYPQFVDTANRDFHLTSTSPCIDAGTDVGIRKDADGTDIPQGAGYDMGVYEYINATTELPFVRIDSIYDIKYVKAKITCTVTDEGSSSVTERGVIWQDGTGTSHTIVDGGSGLGSYTIIISTLTANTKYYINAYATSSVGTFTSKGRFFTTTSNPNVPIINFTSISDVSTHSCNTNGVLISDGGVEVTDLGACYKYIPAGEPILPPTINDYKVINIEHTPYPIDVELTETLTKLNRGVPIYIRRYAINSNGVAYSEMRSVPTIGVIKEGTFILGTGSTLIIEKKGGTVIIK